MRNGLLKGLLATLGLLGIGALTTTACGSEAGGTNEFNEPGASSSSGSGKQPGNLGPQQPCEDLECKKVDCGDPNVTTTVSGVVTAPNGTLPLYNAIVYVPNKEPEPLADGVTCDRCGSVSGKPISATVTDANGKFVLKDVPVIDDLPLVVQVGKWRREIKLPKVDKCVDNPITDVNLTRLPKNQAEGHIPKIAVTTGRCDQLACLLPKLGLDASEYTPSNGNGRLHVYRGAKHSNVDAPAPAGSLDATALWNDADNLKKYDMVLLSCECGEHNETKSNAAKQALYDYTAAGGRVFASHYHYAWTQVGPLAGTAQWLGGSADSSDSKPPFFVDTDFPKGAALADWLVNVGATQTHGEIPMNQPREDVGTVVSPTQRWVYEKRWIVPNVVADPLLPQSTKFLSVNSPVGQPVEQQCGKFVFADMHLENVDVPGNPATLPNDQFPASCDPELTPEEKALAFLFFDLSSCVQDDTKPPEIPIK